jgi:hypothetical protein
MYGRRKKGRRKGIDRRNRGRRSGSVEQKK